jgi:hypothetical protein
MSKPKKTSYFNGDIDKFQDTLSYAQSSKASFKTISSGLSRKIVLDNGVKLRFFGKQGRNNLIDGAFLVKMVQRDIDKWIEKNGEHPYVKPSMIQVFNHKSIERVLKGQRTPIVGIDINSCYWVTAHKLGYISDDLFNRGLDTCKKKGLLIAIGCLNKLPMIKHYKNGVLQGTTFDQEYNARYSPFYWSIISYTHQILMHTYEMFQDDWFMFLTDCVFVSPNRVAEAQKFLTSLGYKHKSHNIEFKKFQNQTIEWYDMKDQKMKCMRTSLKDISFYYPQWKDKGADESTPL